MEVPGWMLIKWLASINSIIYRLDCYLDIIQKFYWSLFIIDKFKMEIAETVIYDYLWKSSKFEKFIVFSAWLNLLFPLLKKQIERS